jgi:hypothetical protein
MAAQHSRYHKIPMSKELHGRKLVSGRGNYIRGNRQIQRSDAAEIYHSILSSCDFILDASVITVTGVLGQQM